MAVTVKVSVIVLSVFMLLLYSGCKRLDNTSPAKHATEASLLDRYRAALKKKKLSAIEPQLVAAARWSVRLTPATNQAPKSPGATRIGGAPDFPPTLTWPAKDGRPLAFIAQINLNEIAANDPEKTLPHQGMLFFFYDADEQPWGFDPKDKSGWSVLYYTGASTNLHTTPQPAGLTKASRFPPVPVSFTREITFLPWESYDLEHLPGITKAQLDRYVDALDMLYPDDEHIASHRLLGHPDLIQGDMQRECQLVTHGIYCGNDDYLKDPEKKSWATALEKESDDWRLLLQIASDEEHGMLWGDSGNLYFWIRQQDLAKRDFSKVWVILQCY